VAEKTAVVDYQKCFPDQCENGLCVAALECEYKVLKQESPYERPVINPARWCHGCTKCARTCPLGAIKVI